MSSDGTSIAFWLELMVLLFAGSAIGVGLIWVLLRLWSGAARPPATAIHPGRSLNDPARGRREKQLTSTAPPVS